MKWKFKLVFKIKIYKFEILDRNMILIFEITISNQNFMRKFETENLNLNLKSNTLRRLRCIDTN